MNPAGTTARRTDTSGPPEKWRPGRLSRVATRRRFFGPAIVAALLVTAGMTLAEPRAHAAPCTVSWTGAAGDGLWTTATNWTGGAPDSGQDVCIGDVATGTYTVTLNTSGAARSISVGGASGTQTLVVGNIFGSLTLSNPSSISANGLLNLDLSYNNASSVLTGSTLTNSGTFRVTGIPSAGRTVLRSNVINNGTLEFLAPETVIDSGVTITNNATTSVAASASVIVRDGAAFVNQAGTLTNAGAFNVRTSTSAGTFTQGGGTVTGNDPVIDGANWNGAGAGAGKFTLLGTSTLSGAIAAAQTLRIDDTSGSGIVNIPTSFTNAGTLIMDMNYNNANTIVQPSTATLTNSGTFRVTGIPSAGRTVLRSNVINNGTLEFLAPETVIDSGVTITNNATTSVAASASVIVRDGAAFVNQAGTLTNAGAFNVRTSTSAGTFTQGGGTVTGNDPVIDGANWNGIGAGAGKFTLLGTSTLSGAIAAAQTLRIDDTSGSGIVNIPTSFTNAGTLIMDMNYNNANTIVQPSASSSTLTNTGTLRVTGIPSSGSRSLRIDVLNSGTFVLAENAVLDFTGSFTQLPGGTTEFDLASATVFGRMVARNAGSVTLNGTANPVLVSGYSPPANSTFEVITSPHAGDYATVTNTFGSDVTNPAFVRLVSGVNPLVAPAITSGNTTTFAVGTAGSFTATATGSPAPVLSVTGTLPSGVSFVNGVLSGTPAASTAGTYPLTVRAANGVNPDATQTFTLSIVNPSIAPAITSANTTTFTVGSAGSFTATATGSPAPVLSVTGTLPSGVSFVNGVLSGTPAASTAGTYPLTVRAANGINPDATQTFTLSIVNPSIAPAITSANTTTFTVGSAGSFTATATGSPTPVLSVTGTLPSGVSFVNGVLSGTPAASTAGTYPLTVRAANGINPDATQAFTLSIVNPSGVAPVITSTNTTTFVVGAPGSFTFWATGTPTPTISLTGMLAPGLSFANGVLSGTPAAGSAGLYVLTIRATNGVNPVATQAFVLRVVTPVVDLAISMSTPNGVTSVGVTYAIAVRNLGTAPTTNPVTVTSSYTPGDTYAGVVGTGWSCVNRPALLTVACTMNGSIAAGGSAPPLLISIRFQQCNRFFERIGIAYNFASVSTPGARPVTTTGSAYLISRVPPCGP